MKLSPGNYAVLYFTRKKIAEINDGIDNHTILFKEIE